MSDILIRNVRPELKREIEERARRDKRSLSHEIEALLQRSLALTEPAGPGLGTKLSQIFPKEYRMEDFLPPRDSAERPPPDFE
jgi:plasmid stability protein